MSSRITHNPDQRGGRLCIRGKRIRKQAILEFSAAISMQPGIAASRSRPISLIWKRRI